MLVKRAHEDFTHILQDYFLRTVAKDPTPSEVILTKTMKTSEYKSWISKGFFMTCAYFVLRIVQIDESRKDIFLRELFH